MGRDHPGVDPQKTTTSSANGPGLATVVYSWFAIAFLFRFYTVLFTGDVASLAQAFDDSRLARGHQKYCTVVQSVRARTGSPYR